MLAPSSTPHPNPLPVRGGEGRVNSRRKGKVGEREFAALLRQHGFDARRGVQFAGGADSPDVVSKALGFLHIEVKRVQSLNLSSACAQAEGDCGGKPWVVAHRKNHAPWLITMTAETFFQLLRGDVPEPKATKQKPPHPCPLPRDGGEGSQYPLSEFFGGVVPAENNQ
ncbi:MAG: uncharacterized protein JWM16_5243 [Verrucomicrobiales bacterium]|nr:uncharacterized protein [Verrucomicrobiales bacterium]